jgi:putative ABC transport system ATP-binding protein
MKVAQPADEAVDEGEREPPVAVHCRGVRKSFASTAGTVWALREIDLDVPRGGVAMLVGPSGCGKTTLISIIAGILAADSGQCSVLGCDLGALRQRELLEFRARRIGFIFQQFHLLPTLSVAQNVAIPRLINGDPTVAALAAATEILRRVGLDARAGDSPATLSGGEQQRVAIARALVHNPDLVVCDEPTSALDHDTGQMIMRMMRRMVLERGTTILIVTHDNRIFPYADRIARMDDGRIVAVDENHHGVANKRTAARGSGAADPCTDPGAERGATGGR